MLAKIKATKRRAVETTLQKMGKSEAIDDSDFKQDWEYTKSLSTDLGMIGNDFDQYVKAQEALAQAQMQLASRLAAFCEAREGEGDSDLAMPTGKMLEASEQFYRAQLHTQKVFSDHVLVPLEDLCSSVLPSLRTQKEERAALLKDKSSYTRRLSADSQSDKLREKHNNASGKFRAVDEQLRSEMQRLKDNRIELVRQGFNAHIAAQADFFKQCGKCNEAIIPFAERASAGKVYDQIAASRRSVEMDEPPERTWTSDRRSMLNKGLDMSKAAVKVTVGAAKKGAAKTAGAAKSAYSSMRRSSSAAPGEMEAEAAAAGGGGGGGGGGGAGGAGGGVEVVSKGPGAAGGSAGGVDDDDDIPDAMPVNLLAGGGAGGGGVGGGGGGGVLGAAAATAATAGGGGGGGAVGAGGGAVKATYSFDGESGEELSFAEGDMIVVTKKNDDGWWEGHLQKDPSKSGVFPSNYVSQA